MSRNYNQTTIKILKDILQWPGIPAAELFDAYSRNTNYKDFYNTLYRLVQSGYVEQKFTDRKMKLFISPAGIKLINLKNPQRDGVWKLVIFDIPEKQKYVRTVLRAKLKSLHFKKWQNSIWVSPFALEAEIEDELRQLAEKYFVRLIKTSEINFTKDLEKLFAAN